MCVTPRGCFQTAFCLGKIIPLGLLCFLMMLEEERRIGVLFFYLVTGATSGPTCPQLVPHPCLHWEESPPQSVKETRVQVQNHTFHLAMKKSGMRSLGWRRVLLGLSPRTGMEQQGCPGAARTARTLLSREQEQQ